MEMGKNGLMSTLTVINIQVENGLFAGIKMAVGSFFVILHELIDYIK